MNIVFRKFQNFSITIYGRKIYREDYFIIPTDSLFFLFAFFYYNDLFSVMFLYLGFVSNPLFRKYIYRVKEISLLRAIFVPLSFFVPLFLMCFVLKSTVQNYYDFYFYLLAFIMYLVSNKFLLLVFMRFIHSSYRGYNIFYILSSVVRFGFAEGFILSQFILSYISFIFLVENYWISFMFLVFTQFSFLSMLYFANKMLDSYQGLVDSLLKLLQEYDVDTYEHSERVSFIARVIATNMGLSKQEIDSISLAAKLHDIGKIDTPSSILRKEGKLTATEFKIITLHPIVASQIVENMVSEQESKFIKYHHFYPTVFDKPVTYRDIPLGARIIMVADVYDALRSKRKYKPSLSHKQVIEEMFKMVEKQLLDHQVFNSLIASFNQYNLLYEDSENKKSINNI
ncbi:MAG: HD domain-containing protein [Candidatus Calescibacterium sp.]|nr:HD domain-containing protein [Candidatus Calescibacterium sp.]